MMERAGKIIERVFRFLPAHLKLQNSVITQQDCLGYLKNDDTEKLLLLDVPYIGSENMRFPSFIKTSVQSILVLLLVTNISLSTRKWLTTYRTQNTHFYITVEVLRRSQIALSIGQMRNIS